MKELMKKSNNNNQHIPHIHIRSVQKATPVSRGTKRTMHLKMKCPDAISSMIHNLTSHSRDSDLFNPC